MAVFTKNLRKHIFVHPGDQHKLHNAIKIALMKDKKKYSDKLEGALLGVSKIQVVGDRYLVVNGFFSMEVVADFQVFSPTVGMTLEGVINKVSRSHYGCLVMDLFNASLSVPDYSGLAPNEGDACSFVVTKVVVDGDLLFIRGEMSSVTPCENYTPFPSYEDTWDPTVNTEDSKPILPVGINIKEEVDRSYDDGMSPTRGKRKRKSLDASSVEPIEDDSFTSSKSSKKHKKKHRKEKEDDDDYSGNSAGNLMNDVVVVKQEPADTKDAILRNGEEDGLTLKTPKKHKKKHKRSDRGSTDQPDGHDTSGLPECNSPARGDSGGPVVKLESGDSSPDCSFVFSESATTSPKKHKKHKKHKSRDSLSEAGGDTDSTTTVSERFMNGSGDHTTTQPLLLPKEEEEIESPPASKKHKKKKHKSKHHSDCDESFVESPSFTEDGKDSVGSVPVPDVVVKTEPISPRKKSRKSRGKDPS